MLIRVPVRRWLVQDHVEAHHRHHKKPGQMIVKLGAAVEEEDGSLRLVGVACCELPRARMADDGWTLEVTRCAVAPDPNDPERGWPNACSFLYAQLTQAARALGWRKIMTYTLPAEGGASLRALKNMGWYLEVEDAGGGSWSRVSRPRIDSAPTDKKWRWACDLGAAPCAYPWKRQEEEPEELPLFAGLEAS